MTVPKANVEDNLPNIWLDCIDFFSLLVGLCLHVPLTAHWCLGKNRSGSSCNLWLLNRDVPPGQYYILYGSGLIGINISPLSKQLSRAKSPRCCRVNEWHCWVTGLPVLNGFPTEKPIANQWWVIFTPCSVRQGNSGANLIVALGQSVIIAVEIHVALWCVCVCKWKSQPTAEETGACKFKQLPGIDVWCSSRTVGRFFCSAASKIWRPCHVFLIVSVMWLCLFCFFSILQITNDWVRHFFQTL